MSSTTNITSYKTQQIHAFSRLKDPLLTYFPLGSLCVKTRMLYSSVHYIPCAYFARLWVDPCDISVAAQQMTSIMSMSSKHLQATFNVKVCTYLPPPQNEGQLAARAGGDHNEPRVPEGFESVFKQPQGHLPDLSWVSFNEPQSLCVVVKPYMHLNSWKCQRF